MPRIINTRPTSIYWLIDIRPETLATAPKGRPFYCGKTVYPLKVRLNNHRRYAENHPSRPLSICINTCAKHLQISAMEIVPPGSDWIVRERHWIALLRGSFPGVVNVSDGGAGAPGNVHSIETRAKISAAITGKKRSIETRMRISAAQRGKPGKGLSSEARAKVSAARKGVKFSDEHRAKLSAINTGKKQSVEHRAKIGAAHKGRRKSTEHRTKISESIRRWHAEQRE